MKRGEVGGRTDTREGGGRPEVIAIENYSLF